MRLQRSQIASSIANLRVRLELVESFRRSLEAVALVEMPPVSDPDPGKTERIRQLPGFAGYTYKAPVPDVGQITARLQLKDAAKAAELLAVAESLVAGEVAVGRSSLYLAKFDPDLSSPGNIDVQLSTAVSKLRRPAIRGAAKQGRGLCCYITGHRSPSERPELAQERAQTVERWLKSRIPEPVRIVVNAHICGETICWSSSGDNQWVRRVDVALAWPAENISIPVLQRKEESLRNAINSYIAQMNEIEGKQPS